MNILILNWRDVINPKSGGAEIVTQEHAKAWIKYGHKVTWFTSSFNGAKKRELIDGVELIRSGNFLTVYFLAPFYYFFSGKKFDIVIDQIHGLPFFTPLYVRRPKLAFIHEVANEIWDYMYPFPLNYIGKFIESSYFKIYKNVKFWVPSHSTARDLERYGIRKANCVYIVNAINNQVLKKPYEAKEKIPTFIFVSRVVKMKGIEEVIRSFFFILKDLKDANLWIVGDGDKKYVDSLKARMHSYAISTKVKFWGRVSDSKKFELMKRAHILLHASVKEGWGLVVIEAASQSTPSIVYNVSGLRDSVINGATGIVLKNNSEAEMGKQAVALIKNKKEYIKFQKNGLKLSQNMTWDKSTKKSMDLLNELINEKN